MATLERTDGAAGAQQISGYATVSKRFHLYFALLGFTFVSGIYLDGWAHNHGVVDDSFFTPYHGVMYSAYLIVFALLVFTLWRNISRGYSWAKALPRGYQLALAGAVLFGVAGFGDMLWHETFGIEEDMEALLSPTHLALGVGAFLIATAPLRAFWHSREKATLRNMLPALIGLTAGLSMVTFFTMYISWATFPYILIFDRFNENFINVIGLLMAVLPVLMTLGFILFLLRRWQLPFGALTVVFALNTVLTVWLHWEDFSTVPLTAIAMPVAGIVGDILLRSSRSDVKLWLFSFVVPFTFTLVYLIALQVNGSAAYGQDLWWKIHMWLGAPFVSGVGGLLLGLLAFPPQIPDDSPIQ
ncbi:MAG: hypothetical protein D6712_15450 [Chloroflexi bacterium]|nr:MAG: hypothetical protein D6712_15450 [Chloroflexota bacterium]